jgi:hypothetical protein
MSIHRSNKKPGRRTISRRFSLCKEDSGPLHPAFWIWTSGNSTSTTLVNKG